MEEYNEQACNHSKARGFGRGGKKTRNRSRCTFIHIGRPKVKRNNRDLEAESNDHEDDHAKDNGSRYLSGFERIGEGVKIRGASKSIEQTESIQHDRGCHRAEQQILET